MSMVLLIGEDELLLETRAAILRATGAETLCCSPASALAIMAERECDVVVLCHSLPVEHCAAIAEVIRERWPNTGILLMTPARMWEQAVAVQSIDAISSTDPERLLVHTAELLARHRPGNANPGQPLHYSPIRFSA